MGADDRPGPDRDDPIRVIVGGLASEAELGDLIGAVGALHRKYDTFPGEVMLELCAEIFALTTSAGVGPIPYEGLREAYLPDYELRGKQNARFRFVVHCSASKAGGLEPDLLEEVSWWRTDDFWLYTVLAVVAVARANAALRGVTVTEVARQLADGHDVPLLGT
jgi:hypothetical protein